MRLTYGMVVRRALVAGLVVGALMAPYMFFVLEPTIDEAITLEESLAAADGPADDGAAGQGGEDDSLFTRNEQVGGGVAATFVYAVVASAIFGTVFAALRHRLPGRSDLTRSLWLAAVAFGTVALMPALKYPANPPAVGDPDTVNQRIGQYLALVVGSVVLAALLTHLSGLLRWRFDDPTRVAVVAPAAIVGYGLLLVVLPGTPDAIDPAVPAKLVWDFRLQSLGSLALLWTGLGLGLGWLLDQLQARDEDEQALAA